MKIRYTTIPFSNLTPTFETYKEGDHFIAEGASVGADQNLIRIIRKKQSIRGNLFEWNNQCSWNVHKIQWLSPREVQEYLQKGYKLYDK